MTATSLAPTEVIGLVQGSTIIIRMADVLPSAVPTPAAAATAFDDATGDLVPTAPAVIAISLGAADDDWLLVLNPVPAPTTPRKAGQFA